ncbi:MAG: hypothetical protein JKY37_30330 [Nannocystaceae bacterium]|nr:hypothetical protein [Nannocystaceae bacterium]
MAPPTLPRSQPRGVHHLYAHRGLPHTFLRNPPGIMEILASADALRFLQGMWDVVQAELPEPDRVASLGLGIEVFSIEADAHAAVVTMPTPKREFEAFFVGLVARLEGDEAFARVFSLVLTSPPGADPEAAMLEWNAKGQHEFVEQRADVDPGAFVDAIEKVLGNSGAG